VRASYIYIYIALGWDGLRPVLVGYVFISCYYKLRNHGAQRAWCYAGKLHRHL